MTASYTSNGGGTPLPAGVISSSTQVVADLPTGTISSSVQLPTGIISSSTQVVADLPVGSVSSSIQISYPSISNIPIGIISSSVQVIADLPIGTVSSSAQINTGSFTGSFHWFCNQCYIGFICSHRLESANSITFVPVSASYAGTDWNAINNRPTTLVSSSVQISYPNISNIPIGIISSSTQIIADLPTGVVSSSTQLPTGLISSSVQIVADLPIGTVSSSVQINTGSFTGSFIGLATSASYAPTILPSGVISSSTQVVADLPTGVVSSSTQLPTGIISSSTQVISNLPVGSVSASSQISYPNISNIPIGIISSSAQVIADLPIGTVSSSLQISTGSFTGSFTGSVTNAISSSYAVTSSYALTAQNLLGTITSASYAVMATSASYFSGTINFPSGLVVTGSVTASSYTGSFTGSVTNAVTASYATTSSAATSITFLPASSSYALSSSWSPAGATSNQIALRVKLDVSSSSTTFANVSDLSATVVSGTTYYFRSQLITNNGPSVGASFQLSGSAGYAHLMYTIKTVGSGLNWAVNLYETSFGSAVGQTTTYVEGIIEGAITVNNGGTLVPQIANNAAGSSTVLKAGSTFILTTIP